MDTNNVTDKPIYRVGMIGTGLMGTNHAISYHLNERTKIVAVADPDQENLDRFCQRFGVTNAYSSYAAMFDSEEIDIAAPILPARPNPEAVIAAARAGVKAIYCEKPIAASLEEADRMVVETESRGIPWAAADAMRNIPQFWQFKEMIASGETGPVRTINIYLGTGNRRGELSGANCQDLSVARMFANDADVDWVVGWVQEDPWDDVDQAMGGYIRFENEVECFINMNAESRRGMEIITSRAMLSTDFNTFKLFKVKDFGETPQLGDLAEVSGAFEELGLNDRPYIDGWHFPGKRMLAGTQAIIDSIDFDIDPKCTGQNMAKVLEISIALRESHRRKHAPVKLPLRDRSLKIIPQPYRWQNRKEVFGREKYNQMISLHRKEDV